MDTYRPVTCSNCYGVAAGYATSPKFPNRTQNPLQKLSTEVPQHRRDVSKQFKKIFLLFVSDEDAVSCENESELEYSRLQVQWRTQNIVSGDRCHRFTSYVLSTNVLCVCPQETLLWNA